MNQSIEEILAVAKREGASDVHITVGIPPKMRVHGNLVTIGNEKLLPADTMERAIHVMNEKQRQHFEEHGNIHRQHAALKQFSGYKFRRVPTHFGIFQIQTGRLGEIAV